MINIRKAIVEDAADAIDTIHCSITELCIVDHHNNQNEIEEWLANKTEQQWRRWIARKDAVVLIAERERHVIGVGMATLKGEILLNYVHPKARFSGVSKEILAGLEKALKMNGALSCRLESTVTAQTFYESCGYRSEKDNPLVLEKYL